MQMVAMGAFVTFIIIVMVMFLQNHYLLKAADKRLRMANQMVLKMAESADKLASSVSEMKDMMIHLEQVYTSRNDNLVKNRDEFKDAYVKLLERYKDLEKRLIDNYESNKDAIFATIRELAQKPTITNNQH